MVINLFIVSISRVNIKKEKNTYRWCLKIDKTFMIVVHIQNKVPTLKKNFLFKSFTHLKGTEEENVKDDPKDNLKKCWNTKKRMLYIFTNINDNRCL